MPNWSFSNGAPTQQTGLSAPTYNDPFTSFLGGLYATGPIDPALATTINAGKAGGMTTGLSAFLGPANNNQFMAEGNAAQGGSMYSDADMMNLAKQLGVDTQGKTGLELQQLLTPATENYMTIGGMSAGWNPTGDPRGANATLYKRENGQLVPMQVGANYSAPQQSLGFIGDHPGILAPLAVVGGGLAAAYLGAGAAGAGASEGAAEGGAGAAGGAAEGAAPMAYMGPGSAGAGASGEGLSTLGQLQALWGDIPGYGQQALIGAGKGGLMSGGDPRAMLTGAATGGIGGEASSLLGGLGLPSWLSGIGGKVVGGLAGMGIGSALGGGSTGAAPQGGPSQGGSGDSGGLSGSGSTSTASTPSDGSLNPHLGYANAEQQAYLNQSYAPLAQEIQRQKMAQSLKDNPDDWA